MYIYMILHELSFNIIFYETSCGNVIKRAYDHKNLSHMNPSLDTFSKGYWHVASLVILDKCYLQIFVVAILHCKQG